MTLRNRWGRLERAAQLYNQRQADRIVALLCAMTSKAVRIREAAECAISALLGQLSQHGISPEQVWPPSARM
jgi:hypothetical protein